MQSDAKHQEDDTDIGELRCQPLIGYEPGRKRAHDDTGDEVTDDRRDSQTMGNRAEDECQAHAGDEGCDEGRCFRHTRCLQHGGDLPTRPIEHCLAIAANREICREAGQWSSTIELPTLHVTPRIKRNSLCSEAGKVGSLRHLMLSRGVTFERRVWRRSWSGCVTLLATTLLEQDT
jgi:hypothetical protein